MVQNAGPHACQSEWQGQVEGAVQCRARKGLRYQTRRVIPSRSSSERENEESLQGAPAVAAHYDQGRHVEGS